MQNTTSEFSQATMEYNVYLTNNDLTKESLPFVDFVTKVLGRKIIKKLSEDGTETLGLSEVRGIIIKHGDGFIQIDESLETEYNDYKFKLDIKFYTKGETFIDHLTKTRELVIGTLDNLHPTTSTIIVESDVDFYYVVDPKGNKYEYIDSLSDIPMETEVEAIEEKFNEYKEHLNDKFLTIYYIPFEEFLNNDPEFDNEFVVEGDTYYLAESGEKLFFYNEEISFAYSEDFEPYIDGYKEFLIENEYSCSHSRFEEYLDGIKSNDELLLDGVEASYEYDGNQFILVEDEPED